MGPYFRQHAHHSMIYRNHPMTYLSIHPNTLLFTGSQEIKISSLKHKNKKKKKDKKETAKEIFNPKLSSLLSGGTFLSSNFSPKLSSQLSAGTLSFC